MKKIMQPCGLHCIKMQDIGVTIGEQVILQHVNLHIHCGTLAAVIGKNGAGKSTLIKAILGDIPHSGTIEFKDRENGHMQKMKIGYVPQTLNIEKKTPISVYDMIASYQSRYPVFWKKSKKVYAKIKEHLAIFKAEDLIDKQVCNLSGGELQRFCIARALAVQPDVLLMDEPTSALDPISTLKIEELMVELKKKYTVVVVTHNMQQAARVSDDTAFFLVGEVIEFNHTDDIFARPQDKRTEDYITGRFG